MLYVLTSATGALLGWATAPEALPPAPPSSTVVVREAWDAPPALPYVWSPTARDWVVPAVTPTTIMSRLAFRWRYTLAEQVGIKVAETGAEDASVRATLAILRESLQEATEIDLADPRTIAGVQFHASAGLITAERATEILTP